MTLIELLITIVVLTLLLAGGVPSFKQFIKNNRVTAQANTLVVAIQTGRSESVKRGTNVVVCASDDATSVPPTCSGSTDWTTGWIAFADLNQNNAPDFGTNACLPTEDCLIRARNDPLGGNTLTGAFASLVYLPTGLIETGNHAFVLKSRDCEKNQARKIHITNHGHTIVTKVACDA